MNVSMIGKTVKQIIFGDFRILRVDDEGRVEIVFPAGTSGDVNVAKIAGTATENGGVAGLLGVGINRVGSALLAAAGLAGVLPTAGTGPDVAVPTASYPSRFAGIVRKILTPLTDTHQQTILVDGDGALWGRSKAFDSISSAERGAVNTAADVHDNDGAPGVQASEANVGASTVSYPNSSGIALGDYTGLDHEIVATDCTFVFYHSLTGGAGTWIPITTCVQDNSFGGMSGFAVFATGVGLSRNFDLTTSGHKGGFLRCDVTYPDGGNAFAWKTAGRYGA